MTEPLCTCGKRPKHKCCEENGQKVGKMCLKGYEAQPINLQGLSEATEDRMSKVDRDIRQLRKELEEEIAKSVVQPCGILMKTGIVRGVVMTLGIAGRNKTL